MWGNPLSLFCPLPSSASLGDKIFAYLANFNAVIVIALGLTVIYGWYTDNTLLIQVSEHFAPMQYNTALCFVLTAIASLCLVGRSRDCNINLIALVPFGIAVTSALEYSFNFSTGLDQLFIKTDLLTKTSHAGRMSPLTTLCFLLLNIGLLSRHYYRITLATAMTTFVLSSLSMISYFWQFDSIYGIGSLQRMAIHTSGCFMLLSMALWLYVAGERKHILPSTFFMFVFTILFSLTLLTTQNIHEIELHSHVHDTDNANHPQIQPASDLTIIVFLTGTVISLSLSALVYLLLQMYGGASGELRRRQEQIALAVENGNVGFWEYDPNGKTPVYSPSVGKQLGYTLEDMRQPDFNLMTLVHPDDLSIVMAALDDYYTKKTDIYQAEFRMRHKDGSWRWILSHGKFTGTLEKKSSEAMPHVVGTQTDITALKNTQEHLLQAKIEAENASKTKSEFLASMSHEIRTPMHGIIGMIDLLSESELTHEQRAQVKIIDNSATHLLNIINEILDFSKIEAGKLTYDPCAMDLKELLEERVAILIPMLKDKGLDFRLDYGSNVPQEIIGDPNRIWQVILNLSSNAIKFTYDGGITIKVHYSPRDREIMISVTDTGIGIPESMLDHIFESFTQIKDTKRVAEQGTGLGLAISKELAEMMGGSISVASKEGRGATFTLGIPYYKPSAAALKDKNRRRNMANRKIDLTKLTLLVAEDIPTNQFVITGILKKIGCAFDIANNGEEATKMIKDKAYDAVLMDCEMPVMNGYDASRKIRKMGYTLPIIALTANAMDENKKQCEAAGMNDFLSKPVVKNAIMEKLSIWVDPDTKNTR